MVRSGLIKVVACAALWASFAMGDAVTLEMPLYAEVFVKSAAARNPKITGNLVRYDDAQITLKTGREEQSFQWAELTPSSAFTLRQRLIDKTKPDDWLNLGAFGWKLGAKDQAHAALRTAVSMDAALKQEAADITSQPAGPIDLPKPATDEPKADEKPAEKEDGELINTGKDATVAQPGRKKGEKAPRIQYQPATPEQHAEAIQNARAAAEKVQQKISVTLVEIETDHFIIFTDWDKREHAFLKKNLEDAYQLVSRHFDMPAKENIFVGKLPVYMWSSFNDFRKFGTQMDGFPVTESIAGYYRGSDAGAGHMSMWKPNERMTGTSSIKDAQRMWGYVLVHEFTHAFIARYRSNEPIPRWLNEGVAEVIASGEIPLPNRRRIAREIATEGGDLRFLFDDENMPSGNYYPVMQSMVELLVSSDRRGFIKLIDAIKDGTEPEEALQKIYKTDYNAFARTWREWAKKQPF